MEVIKRHKSAVIIALVLVLVIVVGLGINVTTNHESTNNGSISQENTEKEAFETEYAALKEAAVGEEIDLAHATWRVLAVEEGKVLLIRKYVLRKIAYNNSYNQITWQNCTLRNWLNETYYKQYFSEEEQSVILETELENKGSKKYGTRSEYNTTDRIFCLSIKEAEKYFTSEADRIAMTEDGSIAFWWLRDVWDSDEECVASGVYSGNICAWGHSISFYENEKGETATVRPAMWVSVTE